MSRRRATRISDEDMNELISKLESLLPESRPRNSSRASASRSLKETCNYIKSLRQEVDDLSERLSELMDTLDSNGARAEIIKSLLRS